ncbi:MAG: hypothetical protein O3A00_05150 [Planctomycetota bacterium]|nr:hypothetical protein [Planctomycetota bacterium]
MACNSEHVQSLRKVGERHLRHEAGEEKLRKYVENNDPQFKP